MSRDRIVCVLLWTLIVLQLYIGFATDKSNEYLVGQACWCIIFSCGAIGIRAYNRILCFGLSILALWEFKDEIEGLNTSLYVNDIFVVCVVLIAVELFILYRKNGKRWIW